MRAVALILFTIVTIHCQSQSGIEKIKIPKNISRKKCEGSIQLFNNKPEDVLMGVHAKGSELFFLISDPNWMDKLWIKAYDGIAVDIVSKDQYECNSRKVFKPTDYYRGFTLDPVFKKKFDKTKTVTQEGYVVFKVGEIPEPLLNKEIEFNLIFIKNKNYCLYHQFYEIVGHKWKLLKTGLFVDTTTQLSAIDDAIIKNKEFKFEIPFKKNKYDYSAKDIKPIYDSLALYNYNIKSVKIEAYSSLEGDKQSNKLLQSNRASSIADAIKQFQNESIQTDIRTAENWVDFFNDIKNTKYANWSTLNKSTIKSKLRDQKIVDELEPILKYHRKAVLYLKLEKRYDSIFSNSNEIIKLFNQSINSRDFTQALKIQRSVYNFIKRDILPRNLIDKLEIPLSRDYALLYSNKIAFEYDLKTEDLTSALAEFKKLLDIVPDNPQVTYNVCALSLKLLLFGDPLTAPDKLLGLISRLPNLGLENSLSDRLLVNYYIIMSERYQYQRKYQMKNDLVKKIYSIYRKMKISSDDALSIAKYFASYQKLSWATTLLKPYINKIDTEEDLLFYYINLTIIRPKIVGTSAYRTLMLNAINKNRNRFCALYNASQQGGVTFQLLDNLFLRKTYCENCVQAD